ncbi:MAG: hypothetical protein J0H80_10095, partial [Rhizobiales bacterium]|nr:hypothetical protein [Hyphomicrobiales bacterium]
MASASRILSKIVGSETGKVFSRPGWSLSHSRCAGHCHLLKIFYIRIYICRFLSILPAEREGRGMRESFAVIADPHLHNVHGNYRAGRIAEECLPDGMELRTLSDTVQSTRLYNESEMNFRAVLEDIARRGVRHVIVVGDYSDDGQDESVAASLALM